MKRCLVALYATAAACVASAQSSVTVFGVIDAAISGYKNQSETPQGVSVEKSQTALTSSGYTGNRVGFRGTEDLGGGLAAGFWLEAGFSTDTGNVAANSQLFNRRATVSLSSRFGEVRLGRDYTPTFWNDNIFDPFNDNGVGASLIATANGGVALGVPNSGFQQNPSYVRASNSIGYYLPPSLGGFYGQFMYALNEKTSYDPGELTPPGAAAIAANPAMAAVVDNSRVGRYIGGRVGYANGKLDVAAAYGESTIGSNYYLGATTTLNTWNLGASYDFGVVKLFGEYSNNKQETKLAANAPNRLSGITRPGANAGLIGVTVPIGVGMVRATYSVVRYNNLPPVFAATPKADQFAIGYVHNLSKRTALYATTSYLRDENGASLAVTGSPAFFTGTPPGGVGNAVPNRSMGYDLGIRHFF